MCIRDSFGPVVGVVGDGALFVGGELVAFHDPFDGAFAVDGVVVGFGGDVLCCTADYRNVQRRD